MNDCPLCQEDGGLVLVRQHLAPTKVNLASLGNAVARFNWDSHFPAPIWAAPLRPIDAPRQADLGGLLPELDRALQAQWRAILWPA